MYVSYKSNKTEVAMLKKKTVDFWIRTITRDKQEHNIVIKGSIQQEIITVMNMYAPHNRISEYMKQKVIKLKRIIKRNKQL